MLRMLRVLAPSLVMHVAKLSGVKPQVVCDPKDWVNLSKPTYEDQGIVMDELARAEFSLAGGATSVLRRYIIPFSAEIPCHCYSEEIMVRIETGQVSLHLSEGTAIVWGPKWVGLKAGVTVPPGTYELPTGASAFLSDAKYAIKNSGRGAATLLISTLEPDTIPCPCAQWP